MTKLEDKCLNCPDLLADGYGTCDHGRCFKCLTEEQRMKQWCNAHTWLEDWTDSLASKH